MLQDGLQRLAIWAVIGLFLSLLPISWSAAAMILVLVFLAEYLAATAGVRQGLEAILSLPKQDLNKLKDLLTRAEQGEAISAEAVRKILQKGFDRKP